MARYQFQIFLSDTAENDRSIVAPQIQIFQADEAIMSIYPVYNPLYVCNFGKDGEIKQAVRIPAS